MKSSEKKSRFWGTRRQPETGAETPELGFGAGSAFGRNRMINPDGSFNVKRTGLKFSQRFHIYHSLIAMPWLKFNLLVLTAYIVLNFIFALLYLWIGIEHITGVIGTTPTDWFFEAFFFSAQSLTTVGYGRMAPEGILTSALAAFESMLGLLGFALATGLLYGKFSKPDAKVIFSRNAVVAPYKNSGYNAFMFRLVNERSNQLIELEIAVSASLEEFADGKSQRKFIPLTLEINKINFFPLPWTVVHVLDKDSPLYYYNEKKLEEAKAEFIILLKGYDDTFSQMVYKRFSYRYEEIQWGKKFDIIFKSNRDGLVNLRLNDIHETQQATLNPLPIYEEETIRS